MFLEANTLNIDKKPMWVLEEPEPEITPPPPPAPKPKANIKEEEEDPEDVNRRN